MAGLDIQPQVTATALIRKASSHCCAAKVSHDGERWICRDCGRPCNRVLGPPQEVTLHG